MGNNQDNVPGSPDSRNGGSGLLTPVSNLEADAKSCSAWRALSLALPEHMLPQREVTGAVAPSSSDILGTCAKSHLDFMNTWQSMPLPCRHHQEASHSVQWVTMQCREQTGGAPWMALTVTEDGPRLSPEMTLGMMV